MCLTMLRAIKFGLCSGHLDGECLVILTAAPWILLGIHLSYICYYGYESLYGTESLRHIHC